MTAPAPLDLTPLASRPSRDHVRRHRRLLREQGRASRTAGQRIALALVAAFALVVVALPPAAIAVALTTDDPGRRTSATAAAIGTSALLLAVAIAAVLARRTPVGPGLLALAERNGLGFDAWIRRDVGAAGSLAVHVSQHDLDVLRDADGVAWGRTTIQVGGGRRSGDGGTVTLASVAMPLGVDVPHLLLADRRSPQPSSIAPEAIGAIELMPASSSPWRAWTTEPHPQQAATIVGPAMLTALEQDAPGLDLELVGGWALLTRRVDARWRADDVDWLDLVDRVRIRVAPALRAAAAAQPPARWTPIPVDEPMGRSLRLELVRRARRDAWVDGALDVASGAA